MFESYWSWVLTAVGLTTFYLAGNKVWWTWYVGLLGQVLWFVYAITTSQLGFIVGSVAYTFVYATNAFKWSKEREDRNV